MSDQCRKCSCAKYRKSFGNTYQCKCDHFAAEHSFNVADDPPSDDTLREREKWATAFNAYHKALSEPYFDQDDESRQSNRAEVQRTFDALKALAEGE